MKREQIISRDITLTLDDSGDIEIRSDYLSETVCVTREELTDIIQTLYEWGIHMPKER